MRQNIVIFASGSGSNAQRIFEYFQTSDTINVASIYCNNPNAFVIERAKKMNIPCRVFSKAELQNGIVLSELRLLNPSIIVLAGFLCLVPKEIIYAFPHKIINIHPALLPKYGGKGMYGAKVHQSVIENQENESGITIHFVNEQYDEGDVIFQVQCEISENDTPLTLADKIHQLEYTHFPKVIERLLKEM
ncbi:MAG: phosphoribosylglycinamide formyltransferase [Bacteroidales bacterium]|nr:phosphoribosylglycinamide formyltransferase [Bacteroidales bacterium]